MKSIIISWVVSLFIMLKDKFIDSAVCSFLLKIYNFFSDAWQKSALIDIVGNTDRKEKLSDSIIYKFFRLPFNLFELFKAKSGKYINEKIKTSYICYLGKTYLQNCMALNTRFFGVIFVSSAIACEIFCLINGEVSKLGLLVAAIGAILLVVDCNFMRYFSDSKFVSFFKALLCFKNVKFDFYDETYTCGIEKIVIAAVLGVVMGVLAIYSPLYAAIMPIALFGMLLVLYAPITGIYAAVFLGAIIPTMMLAGICIWTTLALLIKAITDDNFKWKTEGTGLGLIILLAILFASSVLSFAPVKSLTVWAMYFVFITFFFTFINVVRTKEQLYGIIKVLIISGSLVALYGIMQYLFGWTTANAWIDETMFEEQTMRVYSTLGNPNVLGEFLILVLPFALVQAIKNKANTLAKYGYLAMTGALVLCLVLTQSRGCWLGFFLGFALFVTFWQGKVWGIIPIVLCIMPFIIPQTIVDRLLSIGDMSDSSTSYRVFIWLGTMQMLKSYWLGGIGMGEAAFAKVYPLYSYNAIIAPHSHNTFLQLTVEAGIGALIVFVVTQFVFIKSTVKVYRYNEKRSVESMNALATGCAVISFLLQSMFDYTFYNYRVMALFIMVMAIGISLRLICEDSNISKGK